MSVSDRYPQFKVSEGLSCHRTHRTPFFDTRTERSPIPAVHHVLSAHRCESPCWSRSAGLVLPDMRSHAHTAPATSPDGTLLLVLTLRVLIIVVTSIMAEASVLQSILDLVPPRLLHRRHFATPAFGLAHACMPCSLFVAPLNQLSSTRSRGSSAAGSCARQPRTISFGSRDMHRVRGRGGECIGSRTGGLSSINTHLRLTRWDWHCSITVHIRAWHIKARCWKNFGRAGAAIEYGEVHGAVHVRRRDALLPGFELCKLMLAERWPLNDGYWT